MKQLTPLRFAPPAAALSAGVLVLVGAAALPTGGNAVRANAGPAGQMKAASPEQVRQATASYGKLPLSFEANGGRTAPRVSYISRGPGYTLVLTRRADAVLALQPRRHADRSHVLRTSLAGANPAPRLSAAERLPGEINSFVGPRKHWRTGIAAYGRVRYSNVYPGTDLVYYGSHKQLEYDFSLRPHADPSKILLTFSGARDIRIASNGDLLIQTGGGIVRERSPLSFQQEGNGRADVRSRYFLASRNQVGIRLGAYDRSLPLRIDPTLAYSTYLGGSSSESSTGIAVDSTGDAYVTGSTCSNPFPTTAGAYKTSNAGCTYPGTADAFVTKLNPSGSALVYSTYIGGSGTDVGRGIAVDSAGAAYVTGLTCADFPTTVGAFQTVRPSVNGCNDGFVTKLSPSGSTLDYSTYLGSSGTDDSRAIAVDSAGSAYVTGFTCVGNFPVTVGAYQTTRGDTYCDAYVTKFNASGSGLAYSTYLGGNDDDGGYGIAVDSAGAAYVTGETCSTNFPTTAGAFQPTKSNTAVCNDYDAFATKVNPAGSALGYSTYIGGGTTGIPGCSTGCADDYGYAIAVDSAGAAYVAGEAWSSNFPTTAGAFQTTNPGPSSAFVTKLDSSGAGVYSSFLGSNGDEEGHGIAVDAAGAAWVTGQTCKYPSTTTLFPTTADAYQAANAGQCDAFLTKFNPSGSGLAYSTFLGGSQGDWGTDVAVDSAGDAYIGGGPTYSTDFPTTAGAYQTSNATNGDAFVAKLANHVDLGLTKTASPNPVETNGTLTYTLTVTNNGPDGATGVSLTDTLPSGVTYVSNSPSQGSCTYSAGTLTCNLGALASGASATVTLVVTAPASAGSITNTADVSAAQNDTDLSNNHASVVTTVVARSTQSTTPKIDLALTLADNPDPVEVSAPLAYTLVARNNGPDTATGVKVVDTLPSGVGYRSSSAGSGSCSQAAGKLSCALGSLAKSAAVEITVAVTAPASPGKITSSAHVSGNETDTDPSNNDASATTTVIAPAPRGCTQLRLVSTPSRLHLLGWTPVKVWALTESGDLPEAGVHVSLTGTHGIKSRTGMTDAKGLVVFKVYAQSVRARAHLSAECATERTLRPQAMCPRIQLNHRTLKAKHRALLRGRITLAGRALERVRTDVHGAGVHASKRTNGKGWFTVRIRPRRHGVITVAVHRMRSCPMRIGVVSGTGKQLTG